MKTFLLASLTLLLVALTLGASVGPHPTAAHEEGPPYTFFFTRPEMLGDPNNPTGVRYHSDGKLFANAPDGSKVILSGKGGWNPKKDTAEGNKDRLTVLEDAKGGTVIIDFGSPAAKFDEFWPEAEKVVQSVQWKGG